MQSALDSNKSTLTSKGDTGQEKDISFWISRDNDFGLVPYQLLSAKCFSNLVGYISIDTVTE